MSIIYICDKCGSEMEFTFRSHPPIIHFLYCSHCGNVVEEKSGHIYVTPHKLNI